MNFIAIVQRLSEKLTILKTEKIKENPDNIFFLSLNY